MPPDASLDGHRVDALFALITELTAGCLLVVLVALAFLLVRYRARPGVRAAHTHGASRAHALGVVALAAFMFLAFEVNLVRVARADLAEHLWRTPRGPGVLQVEVQAQRWAWSVRYPGPDNRFDTADDATLTNELRVPLHTPVVLELSSVDVIHSFFLPNFRVKADAVPGRITRLHFQAERAGTYEIACAELCGPQHYRMRGVLTALAPRDFQRWREALEADARRAHAAENPSSRWGWPWRE